MSSPLGVSAISDFARAFATVALGIGAVIVTCAVVAQLDSEENRHRWHRLSYSRPEECSRCRQDARVRAYAVQMRSSKAVRW